MAIAKMKNEFAGYIVEEVKSSYYLFFKPLVYLFESASKVFLNFLASKEKYKNTLAQTIKSDFSTLDFDFYSAGIDAREIVKKYVTISAGTALATGPIPGTSAILTGTEATMVFHIARVYGYSPTLQEAAETITRLVAASGIVKTIAIETFTFIPILGWMVKSSIAAGKIKAVGDLAISFYETKRRKSE